MPLFPVVVVQLDKPVQNVALITSSALFIYQIKQFVCPLQKKKEIAFKLREKCKIELQTLTEIIWFSFMRMCCCTVEVST